MSMLRINLPECLSKLRKVLDPFYNVLVNFVIHLRHIMIVNNIPYIFLTGNKIIRIGLCHTTNKLIYKLNIFDILNK